LRFSATFRFARRAGEVRRQLAHADGLIGFSMLGRPWARRYFTLSVWENEAALQAFVAQNPHNDMMSAMAPDMGPTRFVRWHVRGTAVPPAWSDVLQRIETAGPRS
jgi:heme-degrading monooxygenase HmoA